MKQLTPLCLRTRSTSLVLLVLLLGSIPSSAHAESCKAEGLNYTVQAPLGWVLNSKAGKTNGLCVVGHLKGGSWDKSDAVIYAKSIAKKAAKHIQTRAEVIDLDLRIHKKNFPTIKIKQGPSISLHGHALPTKYFIREQKSERFEAAAYIDEPRAVVVMVLSARNQMSFKKSLSAFKAFVKSYRTSNK
jgi:hypothetical protein